MVLTAILNVRDHQLTARLIFTRPCLNNRFQLAAEVVCRRFPCKALGILIKRDVTADCQEMYCWHWRIALKLLYC